METVGGAGPHPSDGRENFRETLHFEEDHWPVLGLFSDPETDYWLWDFIFASDPYMGSKTFYLRVHSVADEGSASLTVFLKGATNTDHHVVVSLNGKEIGETYWHGTGSHACDLSFSPSYLKEGDNLVEVTGVLDIGTPYSVFYVDSFDVAYRRYYRAVENRLFARGDVHPVITIDGFDRSNIYVFDVSDPARPRFITATTIDQTGGDNYRLSFSPGSADALHLALTIDRTSTPTGVLADRPSELKQANNGADYLVIAPEEMKEPAQRLADYRQSLGLETMVVELEDIDDEFNHGIATAHAIRRFLSYAYHHWTKPPQYVVFAGDGSYDYRNNLAYDDNLMPPLMVGTPFGIFASDNRFADIEGDDGVPEMAVGRLPAGTSEELHSMVDKILIYESAGSGSWRERVLMLADNPDHGGDFPADSDDMAAIVPPGYAVDRIYLSEHTIGEARQLLQHGIEDGVFLLNYIGHGGLDRLADEGMLLSGDLASLDNGERLPVMVAATCIVGRFAVPGYDPLSVSLMLKTDGGAVAVWSPTGLSENSEAKILDEGFLSAVFEDGEEILGKVVSRALEHYAAGGNHPYMLDIYNLLGDPALRMR
jgi:hypothetical protein